MKVYDDHALGIPFVYHYVYTSVDGLTRLMIVNHRHSWCLFAHQHVEVVEAYYNQIEHEKKKHGALNVLLYYYKQAKRKQMLYRKAY